MHVLLSSPEHHKLDHVYTKSFPISEAANVKQIEAATIARSTRYEVCICSIDYIHIFFLHPIVFLLLIMSVAIITATTGATSLRDTIKSVQAQTVPVEHWIVIDGEEFEKYTKIMIEKMPANGNHAKYTRHILTLPQNTGGGGFLCHRINGAVPWLVNTDYVCFLDEDNLIERNHIENLLDAIAESKARWAYAHRKIIDEDGHVICNDNCESLGSMTHSVLGRDDRHIDTNCYMLERDLAMQISPLWNVKARQAGKLEADRHICRVLLQHEPVHGVSKEYSVLYRASRREDSVRADFFMQGNATLGRGVGGYHACKRNAYVFHFDALQTGKYCHGDPSIPPLGEWCPGMWHGLCDTYNLLDGFANLPFIPPNALCLVAMCMPNTLPLEFLAERGDLTKILYTAEGPNIRHKEQWSKDFLTKHFDTILTYWQPLLDDDDIKTVYCHHNARFLDLPLHDSYLKENHGKGDKSVVVVLEHRTLSGPYEIDGTTLNCLDHLRESYVTGLRNITVYGDGWKDYCNQHPNVSLGYSMPRHLDTSHTPADHYQNHDFALIIENCDAVGYVSEKIGDAFMGGAIPLYYGNPTASTKLPQDTYIDIRKFKDGRDLQRYLDTLTAKDIFEMKQRIRNSRSAYLDERGRKSISRAVERALRN